MLVVFINSYLTRSKYIVKYLVMLVLKATKVQIK